MKNKTLTKTNLSQTLWLTGLLMFSGGLNAQLFGPSQDNPFSLSSSKSWLAPEFVDLDADGDLDIMAGETDGAFMYFENTGTSTAPSFANEVENPFSLTSFTIPASLATAASFGDLDNDGDLDMLASDMSGRFGFFENVGTATSPSFEAPVVNPFSLYYLGTTYNQSLADLDDDGDLDLIMGEFDGRFLYFENVGTISDPSFSTVQVNPYSLTTNTGEEGELDGLAGPAFGDLDDDGDFDLISGDNSGYGNVNFYENVGTASDPSFGTMVVNPFGIEPRFGFVMETTIGDLDGDGDNDILIGNSDGDLVYFENTLYTASVNELNAIKMNVSPNPSNAQFQIQTSGESAVEYSVETIDGRTVLVGLSTDKTFSIDLAKEVKGIYILTITIDGIRAQEKISKL